MLRKPEEVRVELRGVMVVMVTPFTSDFELDEEAVSKNVKFMIDKGINRGSGVLMPSGSMGECDTLIIEERKRLWNIVVEESSHQVPIVVGCNHTSTKQILDLCKHAEDISADGVMITPPYYWPLSDKSILRFYKEVAEATKLAVVIYNNPIVTQRDIPLEVLTELAKIDNVVGVKECSNNELKFSRVVRTLKDKFAVIDGLGEWRQPWGVAMGACGFTSAAGNFVPQLSLKLFELASQKNLAEAEQTYLKLRPFLDFFEDQWLSLGPSYLPSVTKGAMNLMGLPGGMPRSPIYPLDPDKRKLLKGILEQLK